MNKCVFCTYIRLIYCMYVYTNIAHIAQWKSMFEKLTYFYEVVVFRVGYTLTLY